MSHTIRVAGSEIAFACAPETTILDAAQVAGYAMPYSCRNGICGSCKGRVTRGEVAVSRTLDGVSAEERASGYTLFCQAKPCSDLEIVPRQIERIDPNARKLVTAKVYRVERPADDVAVLQLRFPAGTRVKFKAGQYLQVVLDGGERRSFSMANPPQQSDGVHLHVRVVPGGRFSEQVLPGLAPGKALRVELPHGDFFLRESSSRPAIFVASGTGFAPIKSIIEDAFRRGVDREMVLYWGARKAKDLYLADLPARWAAERPGFRFVPVLSEPGDDEAWAGRTGFVHKAVMEDFPSLAGREVYACGVPAMINAARRDFEAERGLPPDDFHCDAFVTPADVARAAA